MPFSNLNNAWSNLAPYYNTVNSNGSFSSPNNVTYTQKPEQPRLKFTSFDDGLIRGGVVNAGLASLRDTARVGNFLKSPKGLVWIAKQVGLQLSNPKLEQPEDFRALSNNNTRLYNLGLNTLAQVPLNAFGGHIIRHGILPVGGVGFLDNDSRNNIKGYNYENIALTNDKNGKNRLVGYLDKLKNATLGDTTPILLQEYNGGASSVYGIGKTQIYSTSIKTDNPRFFSLSYKYISSYIDRYRTITSGGFINSQQQQVSDLLGQSLNNRARASILSDDIVNPFTGESSITDDDRALANQLNRNSTELLNDAIDLQNKIDEVNEGIADNDFAVYNHPLYRTRNIQSRIGTSTSEFGPNNTKLSHNVDSINVINITNSTVFYDTLAGKKAKNTDAPVYENKAIDENLKDKISGYFGRDIIKFRIEFLNNDLATTQTDVLAFRAYLNDFNDGMNAKWDSYRYMGRGEEFYVYNGFTRDIGVDFTIYAHSPEEMRPIYQKLNYLMSTFAPDYNDFNKMRGNIGYLTVGDYLYRQPGIFTDIKLSGMLDSNWEIALSEPEGDEKDGMQYEVPKHIKVNLSFKPIHTFLPRKVQSGKYANTPFITIDKKAYPRHAGEKTDPITKIKTPASNKYLD